MASSATFQVYRDAAEQWPWRLVHDNGNIIAEGGEGYTTKRRAVNGLESVKENAGGASIEGEVERPGSGESSATFEVYEDAAERWRWRLVHRNGNIVATGGQGYKSRANAEKGMRSVMRNARDARVVVEGREGSAEPGEESGGQ